MLEILEQNGLDSRVAHSRVRHCVKSVSDATTIGELHTACKDMLINTLFYSRHQKILNHMLSGVARPRPTRACALPSTFQALPSLISYKLRNSMKDQTEVDCSDNNYKFVTNINTIV